MAMKLDEWDWEAKRQRFGTQPRETRPFSEADGREVTVVSGLYAGDNSPGVPIRSLYIGAFPSSSQVEAGSSFTIQLEGGRHGAPYERTFNLQVGETFVADAEGMEDVTVRVLAYAGSSSVQLVVGGGFNPPSSEDVRGYFRYESFAAAPALTRVPSGARDVVCYIGSPNFQWHLYDRTNAVVNLANALAPGDTVPVRGTHYTGSAGGAVAWVIYP